MMVVGMLLFLPQASEKEYFELLFGTPHGLEFTHAAELYGAKYKKVSTWDEFQQVFTQSFSTQGLKISKSKQKENLI